MMRVKYDIQLDVYEIPAGSMVKVLKEENGFTVIEWGNKQYYINELYLCREVAKVG
jgi:hypothetical protein